MSLNPGTQGVRGQEKVENLWPRRIFGEKNRMNLTTDGNGP
jgi:hypothetical protein